MNQHCYLMMDKLKHHWSFHWTNKKTNCKSKIVFEQCEVALPDCSLKRTFMPVYLIPYFVDINFLTYGLCACCTIPITDFPMLVLRINLFKFPEVRPWWSFRPITMPLCKNFCWPPTNPCLYTWPCDDIILPLLGTCTCNSPELGCVPIVLCNNAPC